MKRGIGILASLGALRPSLFHPPANGRFTTKRSTSTIRSEPSVAVDIVGSARREMQATAAMITLPVAILNHGNTVKFTEYSFRQTFWPCAATCREHPA